jgi:hypothetical protein
MLLESSNLFWNFIMYNNIGVAIYRYAINGAFKSQAWQYLGVVYNYDMGKKKH